MNKNIIRVSLIFPIILMAVTAHAQGTSVNDYNSLKNAVEKAISETESVIKLGQDIDFTKDDVLLNLTSTTETKPSIVIDGGDHTLKGYNKNSNGNKQSTMNGDAFIVGKTTTLTLKNITLKEFWGSSSAVNSGAVINYGNLILQTTKDENITFQDNNGGSRRGTRAGDLYTIGTVLINGDEGIVSFGTGIWGEGTISHNGSNKVQLGGNNNQFTGKFDNQQGDVEFTGESFFGGESKFTGGSLIWNADNTSTVAGNLSMGANTKLDVKKNLTLNGSKTTLDADGDYSIADNSTLKLDNFGGVTFNKKISGNGTLDIENIKKAEFSGTSGGFENGLKFKSQNSSITLSNFSDDTNTLKAIASGDNIGSTLTLNNYTGTVETIDIDAEKFTSLNFTGSINTIKGKLQTTGHGSVINESMLTVNELVNGGDFRNRPDKTTTITGATASNSGTIENNGEIKGGDSTKLTNTGTISGGGTIELSELDNQKTFNNGSLKLTNLKNSGTLTVSGEFSVSGDVENSSAINGADITIGTLKNNSGTLTASGVLTVNGETITNTGTINAKTLTANNAAITNNGTITVSETLTTSGKLTNTSNLTFAGGSLADIDNTGNITNSGNLTLGGTITGSNGSFVNSGAIVLNGDASGYNGSYTQNAGSLTVGENAKLFGGEKNINGGTVSITAKDVYYTGFKLGSGVQFNHESTGNTSESLDDAKNGTLKNEVLTFVGSNATATFSGSGRFDLHDDISNGTGNNHLVFNGTKVHLAGSNYSNGPDLTLKNSALDLHGDDGIITNYELPKVLFENTSVDFNIKITKDEKGDKYIVTDTLTFLPESQAYMNVGKIYITSEEDAETGQETYKTKEDVLKCKNGSFCLNVKFNDLNSEEINNQDNKGKYITVGTDKFIYHVHLTDNKRSVYLENRQASSGDTLHDMNALGETKEEHRQFNNNGEYNVTKDLGKTGSGKLEVFGANEDKNKDILNAQAKENEEKHSLFDIESDTHAQLYLDDLTITNADKKDNGGSVVYNNSANSEVYISDSTITNNTATGNGGAIYNNGSYDDNETYKFAVRDTEFSGNTASKGGAIYNDTKGKIYLEDIVVNNGGELTEGKNDIYNNGALYATGTNTFNSLFTNADGGNVIVGGTNTFAKIENGGTIDFIGGDGTQNNITKFKNTSNATLGAYSQEISDFENSGNATVGGIHTHITNMNNSKDLTIGGADVTVDALSAGGTVGATGGNLGLTTVTGSGAISNTGAYITLNGDASGFTGTFTQGDGVRAMSLDDDNTISKVTVVKNKFFGGTSEITDGGLLWLAGDDGLIDSATLTTSGKAIVQIGTAENTTTMKLNKNSKIDSVVDITNGSSIDVNGGNVTLNDGSVWAGTVKMDDADSTFTINADNAQTADSILDANNGNVSVGKNRVLYLGANSRIADNVKVTVDDAATLYVQGGDLTLNDGDKTSGLTVLDGGTLNYGSNVDASGDNAKLQAINGTLNLKENSKLTLHSDGSFVAGAVSLNIEDGATIDLTGGDLVIDDADVWNDNGKINLDGGSLYYHVQKGGDLVAKNGNLNLMSGSVLTIDSDSDIDNAVNIDVQDGATIDIQGAEFEMDSDDKWNGVIKNDGGTFTVHGIDNTSNFGGQYQQTDGQTLISGKSNIVITGENTSITGGDITVDEKSSLKFAEGTDINLQNLTVAGESSFSTQNGVAQLINGEKLTVKGQNNFAFDIDVMGGAGDRFVFDSLTSEEGGTINISDFDFVGTMPNRKNMSVQLFDVDSTDVDFTVTDKTAPTPIGDYSLSYDSDGYFNAKLEKVNSSVMRGQASTLAVFNNQLTVDEIVMNHINLRQEKPYGEMPARRIKKQGDVWAQAYANMGKLKLTHGIEPDNNSYGVVVGLDLPHYKFQNRWNNITSLYISYNGATQKFDDVEMSQNGGQIGLMETFNYNDFATSFMLFGGMYSNKMDIAGFSDSLTNWLAGAAARASYNYTFARDFTLQPNVSVAYTAIGKQDWTSDYGNIDIVADRFNGLSVAPGLTFMYEHVNYNMFASGNYVFHIMDELGGHAGYDIDLPDVGMDSGYFVGRIGVAQNWGNNWDTNIQIVGRAGSRTDFGLQIGAQWKF